MGVKVAVRCLAEGFRVEATHGPSATRLVTTPPVDNQGDGSSFSPTDLAATAYATCLVTILAMAARKHGIDLAGTTAEVEKVMSAETPRRIVALPLTVVIPVAVPVALRERLEQAARACPVALSLHPAIDSTVRFDWR